jgi:protein-L-isoaspartate(D-aspartate) O-methyltransferase
MSKDDSDKETLRFLFDNRWAFTWPQPRESSVMSTDLEHTRIEFAESLRQTVGLRSAALVRAFGMVPREHFIGPGPWKILVPPNLLAYRDTPDADPRYLYANVLVAIDASRRLNNGEPAALARWLDTLDLAPGERFLHIGCGVGYYTAIGVEAVSPGGSVLGVEIDPELAERTRRNLAPYANVTVVCGDGSGLAADSFDAIFVNAGATQVQPGWIEQLRPGGRLLVPLTVGAGVGHMLLVTRCPTGYVARFVSPVGIFHCAGARTEEGEELLKQAYARGGRDAVRSLRRDEHPADVHCWLHGPRFCLSRLTIEECSPTSASSRPV